MIAVHLQSIGLTAKTICILEPVEVYTSLQKQDSLESGVWSLKSARGCKSRTVPCLEPLALAGPGADHRPFSSLDHCISESRRQARPAVSDRPGPVARQELVRAEGNQDRTARSTDRRSETRPSRQPRDKERWNLDQTSGRTDHSSKTRPCRQTCTSEME